MRALRGPYTYALACMLLAMAAVVNSAVSFVSMMRRTADYGHLIVVVFPLASARRSSASAGQIIAHCCGGFPSLAADLPAVVFGGGCQRIWPCGGLGADASWTRGVLVLRPAGRRREPAVTNGPEAFGGVLAGTGMYCRCGPGGLRLTTGSSRLGVGMVVLL